MTYDSRPDTIAHAARVQDLLQPVITELGWRADTHDQSKLGEPEKSMFDRVTTRLKTLTYGSDEYKAALADMGEGLKHHYAHNRHHPEHFEAGIDDMTLVDLLEMLADWKAATERHDDGDLAHSLVVQRRRFAISSQLLQILENTAIHFGWLNQGGDDERAA